MLRSTTFRLTLLVLMALGGLLVYGLRVAQTSRRAVAEYVATELNTLPDENVPAALAQLPHLEEPGFEVLVRSLGHERLVVARAASAALDAELETWRLQSAAESSPHVVRLARLLARHVEAFAPAARSRAAVLAEQLLEWPIDSHGVNGTQLVADCETVLAASDSVRVARNDVPDTRRQPRITSPENLVAPPGAAADLTPAELPPRPAPAPEPRAPRTLPRTPAPPLERELDAPVEPPPPPQEPAPFEPPIAPRLPRPARLLPESLRDTESSPDEANTAAVDEAAFLEPDTNALPFSLLTDFAVMQALQAPHGERARAAELELLRRGYSPQHVAVARRLTDPDPVVRRQLCDALAKSGGDALPWLKQLAHDRDTGVRLAAISVLSTSADPAVRDFLRDLQLREAEKPVRDTLKRVR